VLRLTTFGGLTLLRGDLNLTGAATQRRRLAILVLLATSRARGVSRDRLLGYLWPESDAQRARHVLNQLLHAQRRKTGEQQLFLGGKTLRLNPALISSDVAEFEAALEAGEEERAASLYTGPFLDGFFLSDAPDFERWVDEQRERLARRCVSALQSLAQRAAGAGDGTQALRWRRQAFAIDPLDTEVTLKLAEGSAAAGDRVGAIRIVREHEAALRRELGLEMDARLRLLAERLQHGKS